MAASPGSDARAPRDARRLRPHRLAENIRLPIPISIDAGNVGGPSAGLAFALDALEELGRDVDHGHRVAATGEIELDGAIAPIGGVKQKTIGARKAKVDAFLVPAGDNAAEARRYADSGHLVALVGHADHVEVIGTRGERPYATVVVESPEEAARLDSDGRPVAVISQTTLSLDDVRATVDALEQRFGTLRRPAADDICYATQNRQDAVKRLAEEATLILVIGSQTSSNAQRLVEVARLAGADAELIDGESELPADAVEHEVIGLTAGASTPEQLVEATIQRLAALGFSDLEEITVAREDVHFRLPREVAAK